MATPLYTSRVIRTVLASTGATATYTVPAGLRLVVVDISVVVVVSPAGVLAGIAPSSWFAALVVTSTAALGRWTGRQVLEAGETLTVQSNANSASVWVTGWLLTV